LASNIAWFGAAQQRVQILPVGGIERDAHAGAQAHLVGCELEGRSHCLQDSAGDQCGRLRLGYLLQDDREFVAAEAGHRIALADGRPQALRHRPENLIAHRVAEPVVHCLEAVQVHEQQRHRAVMAAHLEHGLLQPVSQQQAVGQAGEHIVVGEVLQILLSFQQPLRAVLQRRHISAGLHDAAQRALGIEQRRCRELQHPLPGVLQRDRRPASADLLQRAALTGLRAGLREAVQDLVAERRPRLRRQPCSGGTVQELHRVVFAEHPARRRGCPAETAARRPGLARRGCAR
jgi:hypothetical protein